MMIYFLIFFSGFAGLVYEVLWMKQLGLLFGSTAHAAAATLACLFAGLSAGSWFWGGRSARAANALRLYAILEIGIALAALLYFGVLPCYHLVYPFLYQTIHSQPLLLSVKFLLTLLLVFPPAFCMGGTLPVIGQYLIRQRSDFGTTAARVYGINTLGAALGAYMAGFHFPVWLGFRTTFVGAMAVSIAVAGVAFRLARPGVTAQVSKTPRTSRPGPAALPDDTPPSPVSPYSRLAITGLCFMSGFGLLALEVLWTRIFGQILENSVYTYSTILVVVLLCLAGGAMLSSWLARTPCPPLVLLSVLALLGGLAVAITPAVVMRLTNSLQVLSWRGSWPSYVGMIFQYGAIILGPPALLLGTVFPLLMKAEERQALSAGQSLGRMSAINTAGAILGSLACGFVFLEMLGMWRTMQWLAVLYIAASLAMPCAWNVRGIALKGAGVLAILFTLVSIHPARLPITSVDPLRNPEAIMEAWEGRDCTVAVTRDRLGLAIKINSHYGLGSTASYMQAKLQNDIPLMAYPQTEDIFFLGMGTGITAGGSLDPQFAGTKRVVACELVPEVITAARKYFTDYEGFDYTGGLFTDPRVTLMAEDGRHYLMAAGKHFDMINADLFVPYRVGDGSLYSREHFQSVKKSLRPGGVFFQWLPLYMMTEYEFSVIARTMLDVFDHVSLWRGNFQPGDEIVALAGHTAPVPLAPSGKDYSADRRASVAGKTHRDIQNLSLPFDAQSVLFFYAGNISASRERFEKYPVNRDDRPLIEYMAPRTYRQPSDVSIPWFVGPRIVSLSEELLRRCPPDDDPLLANRTPQERRLPLAGIAFHRARVWELVGQEDAQREDWQRFVTAWTIAP